MKNKLKEKRNKDIIEFNLSKKSGFIAVWVLFNRYFIKSFMGPFFSFAFPLIIYGILGGIMGYDIMFSGIASITAMSTGITGMPIAIMELKKSILLKRIGASPVKPLTFTLVIIVHYIFVIFLSILWLMLWALIFTQDTSMFAPLGELVGFFGFMYGHIINIILSLTLGFMISSLAKSEQGAQAIGMMIYFPSAFLSGAFVDPASIASNEAMNYLSKILPFRYTTMYIAESWYGKGLSGLNPTTFEPIIIAGNPFLIHDYKLPQVGGMDFEKIGDILKNSTATDPYSELGNTYFKDIKFTTVWDKTDHIVGYIYPFTIIGLSTFTAVRKFKWSAAR